MDNHKVGLFLETQCTCSERPPD